MNNVTVTPQQRDGQHWDFEIRYNEDTIWGEWDGCPNEVQTVCLAARMQGRLETFASKGRRCWSHSHNHDESKFLGYCYDSIMKRWVDVWICTDGKYPITTLKYGNSPHQCSTINCPDMIAMAKRVGLLPDVHEYEVRIWQSRMTQYLVKVSASDEESARTTALEKMKAHDEDMQKIGADIHNTSVETIKLI